METFDFDQSILDIAKKVTLADLLDSPFTQFWAISSMSNAINNLEKFAPHETEADELLEARLLQVFNRIPYQERKACYMACKEMITERRAFFNAQREQATAE